VERVVLNALGDDCGSAALYLRPLRSICHRLRRSRSTLRQARNGATSWQSYLCARRGNSRVLREFPHKEFQPAVTGAGRASGAALALAVASSAWMSRLQ
jgi:hypothetical protein